MHDRKHACIFVGLAHQGDLAHLEHLEGRYFASTEYALISIFVLIKAEINTIY